MSIAKTRKNLLYGPYWFGQSCRRRLPAWVMAFNHPEFEDLIFREPEVNDFKCEVLATEGNDLLRVSIEVRPDAHAVEVAKAVGARVRKVFEVTPVVVVLEIGTLAREFETSVKAPRFVDRRGPDRFL